MAEIDELKKEIERLNQKINEKGENQKKGMIEKASKGDIMSRAPFGYIIQDKKLIPAQNFVEIEEIFQDFLNNKISLRQLAQKHQLSVNGLKKILTNFTYIGKIKFNNQIHDGNHQSIISTTLFNHVQNKLERLGIK
jgi:DNA invertase Pin-like site-specific DNA recombinase